MTTIGYVRVSGRKQVAEGYGLATQERRIRAYATSQGWDLHEIIRDEGESGAVADRPGFMRLRDLAEAGRIKRVIVFKLDRLSRSLLDLKHFVDRTLLPTGTSLVSVTEQLDTSSSSGKLFFNILGSFAEFERDLITERLKAARESKVLRGCKGSGRVYGYRWAGTGRDRALVPAERESSHVQWLFQTYIECRCLTQLAAAAGSAGIQTRDGKPFARSSLRYLLSNRFYIGEVQHGRLHVQGHHEKLIALEDFERVQRLIMSIPRRREATTRPLLNKKSFRPLSSDDGVPPVSN